MVPLHRRPGPPSTMYGCSSGILSRSPAHIRDGCTRYPISSLSISSCIRPASAGTRSRDANLLDLVRPRYLTASPMARQRKRILTINELKKLWNAPQGPLCEGRTPLPSHRDAAERTPSPTVRNDHSERTAGINSDNRHAATVHRTDALQQFQLGGSQRCAGRRTCVAQLHRSWSRPVAHRRRPPIRSANRP